MKYDVIIIGAGPGGIFSAYELMKKRPGLKVGVFEAGTELEKRHCPIDGEKIKTCIRCKNAARAAPSCQASAGRVLSATASTISRMISAARSTNISGRKKRSS